MFNISPLNRPGAAAALALAEDPGRFLSTVQIGITLVGVLAGAFSGSALGGRLAAWLASLGVPQGIAEPVGFGAVVAIVTYLSIVVGELVPKRLGLRNPEGLACRVAPLMAVVSRVAAPVAWLLDASSDLIFRLLGLGGEPEEKVTDEDLRALVAEAERHGTIETAERRMIAGVRASATGRCGLSRRHAARWAGSTPPRARRRPARSSCAPRIPACRSGTARRTCCWAWSRRASCSPRWSGASRSTSGAGCGTHRWCPTPPRR